MTNEEWLESRKSGIGGSEAGALLGLNKYANATTVAMKKLAQKPLPAPTAKQQYTLDFGHAMEPIILKLYEAISGNITYVDRHQYRHPNNPFMLADCDGFAITEEGEPILLELKSYNYNLKDEWKSGVFGQGGLVKNPEYIAQVRHYLSVLNLNRADIIAQCGNMADDLVVITVYRDIPFEKKMIDVEKDFWDHIEHYEIPETTTLSEKVFDEVRSIIYNEADKPADPEKPVQLTSDLVDNFNELTVLKEQEAELNKTLKRIAERKAELMRPILEQIGQSTSAELDKGDGTVIDCTNKATVRETIDKDKLMLGFPKVYAAVRTTTESKPIFRFKEKRKKRA
jgi:predicted phage-related endonuclease